MANLKIRDKRVLSIQDISCFGKCSLTVALPIITACGIETDILPAAILSTHTGGFSNYTFRDLTEDMPLIEKHWRSEGIAFDAIYSGYLGNEKQIAYVSDIMDSLLYHGGLRIVDPAMADNGKLYKGFDISYVEKMRSLCAKADILAPNITEACLLTGTDYKENHNITYINSLLRRLSKITKATIILKGVRQDNKISVVLKKGEKLAGEADIENIVYITKDWVPASCHGTGDIFISAVIGAFLRGKSLEEAISLAMDFVSASIERTLDDKAHWYGVKFEQKLLDFIKNL